MTLAWVNEPDDYSGEVGSSLPVSAEVTGGEVTGGCPVGNSFYEGGNIDYPFSQVYFNYPVQINNNGSADVLTSGTTHRVEYSNAGIGDVYECKFVCNFPNNIPSNRHLIDISYGSISTVCTIYFRSNAVSGGIFTLVTTNQSISSISWIDVDTLVKIKLVQVSISECVVSVSISGGGTTKTFDSDLIQGTTFPLVPAVNTRFFATSDKGFKRLITLIRLVSNGLPNNCTGEYSETQFTLEDNAGTTRETTVSTDGLYSHSEPNMQTGDSGTWNLKAVSGSEEINSPFEVSISSLFWVSEPINPNSVTIGETLTISAEVSAPNGVNWLLTKDSVEVDSELNSSGVYSFSKTVEQSDISYGWVLSATVGTEVVYSSFVVIQKAKEYGEFIYLLEISAKVGYEPYLATSANLAENVNNSIISTIVTGEPEESNYWTDWGGTYDNPKDTDIELFYGQFLVKVDSIEALVLTEMSFTSVGNVVYSNTKLYPWQYFRALSSTRSTIGFSTTVRDPLKPSDDEYDGRRYPVKLSVPSVTNVSMPDPINGIILNGMFKATLENGDGYFDSIDNLSLFNTPARLLKTAVLKPVLSDFDVIRYGLVENQKTNFSTFTIDIADVFRTLTEPVCRTITLTEYPGAGEKVDSIIPVAWGSIVGAPLIDITDGGNGYICCDVEYIKDVYEVYDSDGKPLLFAFDPATGVISTSEKASYCDFLGKEDNTIGEIIVSEVSTKAGIAYVPGVWDIAETDSYISTSSSVNLLFSGSNVKKLVEQCVQSDSAFLMSKNNGLVTIRRFGDEYETHTIEAWRTTIDPEKDFSDQKYFASSISIGYNHDYDSKTSKSYYLHDVDESKIIDIYNKKQRLTYETKLASKIEAGSLAQRLLKRLSRKSEIVQFGTSANTALINIGDTVVASVDVNGRKISQFTNWFVVDVNPAQDTLELEQKFADVGSISGLLSTPSNSTGAGLLSHPTNENESGILPQPTIVTEV